MLPTTPAIRPSPNETSDEIRRLILDAAGDRVRAIILYGSRTKGTATPRSDWDVVVVLRDPVEDWIDEGLRLAALFYDRPFAVDLQAFAEGEFREDVRVPGTLAYAVSRRGEYLYDSTRDAADRGHSRVDRLGAR